MACLGEQPTFDTNKDLNVKEIIRAINYDLNCEDVLAQIKNQTT